MYVYMYMIIFELMRESTIYHLFREQLRMRSNKRRRWRRRVWRNRWETGLLSVQHGWMDASLPRPLLLSIRVLRRPAVVLSVCSFSASLSYLGADDLQHICLEHRSLSFPSQTGHMEMRRMHGESRSTEYGWRCINLGTIQVKFTLWKDIFIRIYQIRFDLINQEWNTSCTTSLQGDTASRWTMTQMEWML